MSGDAVVTVDQRTGDVVVEKMGITGLRGRDAVGAPPDGADDPGDLTLIFDNKLL